MHLAAVATIIDDGKTADVAIVDVRFASQLSAVLRRFEESVFRNLCCAAAFLSLALLEEDISVWFSGFL